MRVFITGEKGFIGTNLIARAESFSDITIITGYSNFKNVHVTDKGEPCVHKNDEAAWVDFLHINEIDVVIHNAAVVGTDVCALNPREATLTNVQGTYNICRAAKSLNIAVCYMGTTVIYDTPKYQDKYITEHSTLLPTTLYGIQKLASESIVKTQTNTWMIVRPLFAYGGVGDMNSLIAKTIFATLNNKKCDMFLDTAKIKDYLHVNDYCDAVLTAIKTDECWKDDFNISLDAPYNTAHIVELIEAVTGKQTTDIINWFPDTDYLGNHRLDSQKFRTRSGWQPKISLLDGIQMSYDSIKSSENYNPLKHLEEAKNKNIDLTEFFQKQNM
tara:strand:- start:6597 stop:7583 length:987 start_codon:yes stop_codon:yes gene_type:complete